MQIETKFSLEDEVWIIWSDSKARKAKIIQILITLKEISYSLSFSEREVYTSFSEKMLFKTEKEAQEECDKRNKLEENGDRNEV